MKLTRIFYSPSPTDGRSSLLELLILTVIGFILFNHLLDILFYVYSYLTSNLDISSIHMNMNSDNSSSPKIILNTIQDPGNQWFLPKVLGSLGTTVAVYRVFPGNQRTRAIMGLCSMSITVLVLLFNQAVSHPQGFNQLMFSLSYFKTHGRWSSLDKYLSDPSLNNNLPNLITKTPEEVNKTKYIGDGDISLDSIVTSILNLFKNKPVDGYLDELLFRQEFFILLLFIMVASLIIMLILFIYVNTMLHYKDFFLSKFNNRFIKFYIKYQILLARISILIIPLFMLFGLTQIAIILYYLVTHPIPIDSLPFDVHIHISNKK